MHRRPALSASLDAGSIPRCGPSKGNAADSLIPVKGKAAAWNQDAPSPPEIGQDTPGGIFVLVRDTLARKLLMESAAYRGFAVRGAASVEEAASMFAEDVPDLLVLDAKLHRAVTDTPRSLPVIVIAGHSDEDDLRRFRLLGYDRVISQPVSVPRFIAEVSSALR